MPRSFDPYIALGFRVFVDFLFTQSLSRMALVALWTLVGMLLADIAPNVWRDSGLRRVYRRVRREARHVKRAMPDIRIKNDIPTVRLFSYKRTPSTVVSIRSDRATPAQSPAPERTPMPGPPRRPGRTPPGTFPDSSGWSETETEVTTLRARMVMSPGPSPALIPTRIDARLQHTDTSNVPTPRVYTQSLPTTGSQSTTILLEMDGPISAPSGHMDPIGSTSRDPPTIPDDWVDITPPLRPQVDAPVIPPLPGLQEPAAGPSNVPTGPFPRPPSVVEPTPRISVIPDIPDALPSASDACQVPLPESRAATVIGGAEERPSGVWRSTVVARMEKACSELGVDPLHAVAPYPMIHTSNTSSKLQYSFEESTLDVASKVKSEKAPAVSDPEPQTVTPTQVDPSVLHIPVDAAPLPPPKSEGSIPPTPHPAAINANTNPVPDRDTMGPSSATEPPRDTTYLDPDPSHDPPPSFSEAMGEVGREGNNDPVTQDEQPTGLSDEQKAAEERRQVFLMKELSRLETERDRLQTELESKLEGSKAFVAVTSKLDGTQNLLSRLKARISKMQFSGENDFLWDEHCLSSV